MKKRNTTIFAFLLLAAVGMGVGYAAFSQEFDVNGTLKVDLAEAEEEFKEEIIFSAATATTTKAAVDANPKTFDESIDITSDSHVATWTISNLQAAGDYCVGEFTVKNKSDIPAYISRVDVAVETTTGTNKGLGSLFEVKVENLAEQDPTANLMAAEVGEYSFTVTVTMKLDPTIEQDYSFNISFAASTYQEI